MQFIFPKWRMIDARNMIIKMILHKKSVEYIMKSFITEKDYIITGFVKLSDTGKVKEIEKKIITKKDYYSLIDETVNNNKYQLFNIDGLGSKDPVLNLLEM